MLFNYGSVIRVRNVFIVNRPLMLFSKHDIPATFVISMAGQNRAPELFDSDSSISFGAESSIRVSVIMMSKQKE